MEYTDLIEDKGYYINSDYAREEYRIEQIIIEHEKEKHKEKYRDTALMLGKDECQNCGCCCKKAPCKLAKGDIEMLAKRFNMTTKEVFQEHLTVDSYFDDYYVVPIREGQEDIAGGYISDERSYTDKKPCIYLEENAGKYLCVVHDVKPSEGEHYKCWEKNRKSRDIYIWDEDDLEELGWLGEI